jgi:UPF0755 protein
MSKFITYLVLFLILASAIFYWRYESSIYSPIDSSDTTNISFVIKKGESAKTIAQNLEKKGLIKSNLATYIYIKFHNLDEKFIAGRFLLNKAMTTDKIISTLCDISHAEFVITIQEGLTIKEIDEKIYNMGLIKSGDFISAVKNFNGWEYYPFLNNEDLTKLSLPLEGYIYPDTYYINPNDFKSEEFIYTTLDNFEKKFTDYQSQIKRHSINQIITMASILEKEVRGMEDKKIVSGILWKRLEADWQLGADATILYITDDNKITSEDLNIDSPYNTRKNKGLPPGPISNPSMESIEAAMYPQESDYWFYLTTLDTGEVIYAKTNDEQNANKEKYLY